MKKSILLIIFLLFIPLSIVYPSLMDNNVDIVLGQVDLDHGAFNSLGGASLNWPYSIAIDTTNNRVFIADTYNNRVLWWDNISSLTNGEIAHGVLGQPDLSCCGAGCSQNIVRYPRSVEVDPFGNVWVADDNNRILRFSPPFTNGKNANIVLGQNDFDTGSSIMDFKPYGLRWPLDIEFDSSGNLWVADHYNERVLRFSRPFSDGQNSDIVIGQPSFDVNNSSCSPSGLFHPYGLAFDSTGNLWVSDHLNHRVLRFSVPLSSGMNADIVLGHSDFFSSGNNTSANGFNKPTGICFDNSGNLFVTDMLNFRAVKYEVPFSSGMSATLVLGQSDLSSKTINTTSSNTLLWPRDVKIDSSGNVWIADSMNNRVMRFANPTTNNQAANLVLGQPEFIYGTTSKLRADRISGPFAVAVDRKYDRVFVADTNHHRILWWDNISSFTNGKEANGAIGQPDVFSSGLACDENSLHHPYDVSVDNSGNLWVCDRSNCRILRFSAPFSNGKDADVVIGQSSFFGRYEGAGQSGLNLPYAICVDNLDNLWVADTYNNRVIRFSPPFSSGMNADLILGAPNFYSSYGAEVSSYTFEDPRGIFVDNSGNVWVADTFQNRVLRFSAPITNGQAADLVLGQKDFIHKEGNQNTGPEPYNSTPSAETLFEPSGIGVDQMGNVWVSDKLNSRVLRYSVPLSNGMPADILIGQPNYSTRLSSIGANGLYCPQSLIVDSLGDLWVADTSNNRILKFTSMKIVQVSSTTISKNSILSVSFYGEEIPNGATIRLRKENHTDICPAITNVINDTQINCELNLVGACTGYWDIVLEYGKYGSIIKNGILIFAPSTTSPEPQEEPPITTNITYTNLDNVYTYPNPYRPNASGSYGNSNLGQGVVFSCLPLHSKIKIFTISGEFVNELECLNQEGWCIWDTLNKTNQKVASGIYIYYIVNPNDPSQKAKGKTVIIR